MSREEDIEIAIALFGARWQGTGKKHARLVMPGLGCVAIREWKEITFTGYQKENLPAYTSDPAADYQVLVKVRETWDDMDMNEFSRQVCKQCKIRLGTDYVTDGTVWIFLQGYTPGAYSRAALAVLKAKQPAAPGEPA